MSRSRKAGGADKVRIDPVEVCCRVRPLSDSDVNAGVESCLRLLDECNLMLQIPPTSNAFRSGQVKQLIYSFSKIFDQTTTQRQLFDAVGSSLIQDLVNGKNGLLFTYGVTGSGKTYSMVGNQSELGILQRSLDSLFSAIAFRQAKKYTFKADKANSFEIQSETDASLERQQKRDYFTNNINNNNRVQSNLNKLQSEGGVDDTSKVVVCNEDHIYSVFVSCTELYNNYIYDLLDDNSTNSNQENQQNDHHHHHQSNHLHQRHRTPSAHSSSHQNKESKSLKEDSRGQMYIKDVTEIEVKSTEEALELMHRAQKKRQVASTDLNAESSRSHSIFTIRLVQSSYDQNEKMMNNNNKNQNSHHNHNVHVSQLSLVDLAGSERTKRTKNTGSRLKEAGNINSSLMALRNCMEALRENINSSSGTQSRKLMVPYRDSKLTLLFKNYFEGHGKIKMILCINPSSVEFDETINVLKFSDLVKDILLPAEQSSGSSISTSSSSSSSSSSSGSSSRSGANRQALQNIQNVEKMSLETLEQAHLSLLANLQKNNYSLMGQPMPPLDVFACDDDQTIRTLVSYLEELQQRRSAILHETDSLKSMFYTRLRDLNEDFDVCKHERDQYKARLDQHSRDQVKSESKIRALEKVINGGSASHSQHHHHQASSSASVPRTPVGFRSSNNMNNQFNENNNNNNNTPGGFRSSRITHTSQSQSQSSSTQHSNHHHSTMTSRTVGFGTRENNVSQQPPLPPPSATPTISSNSNNNSSSNNGNSKFATPSRSNNSNNTNNVHQQQYLRHIQQRQQESAQQLAHEASGRVRNGGGVPVANRRAATASAKLSRRSRSADMWLDHKPEHTAKMDTLMQPKMERKKSVSRVELSDTRKSTKYALTHQQQDEAGEVVTNLIKGKIIQSPSGGANVIFTDIETLNVREEETPQSVLAARKRRSSQAACGDDAEQLVESSEVVEERCSIAIEGHPTSTLNSHHHRVNTNSNKKMTSARINGLQNKISAKIVKKIKL